MNYPKLIKSGSAVVRVYRTKHARMASGFVYQVAWTVAGSRKLRQFADEAAALEEARLRAGQLAAGRIDAATIGRPDMDELRAARQIVGKTPLLAALKEWAKASEITQGQLLAAAEAWRAKHAPSFKRIKLSAAIRDFIRQKDRAGKQGSRTYGSKLKKLTDHFTADPWLDDITTRQLSTCYATLEDAVSRNDYMKKAGTLWNWARSNQHLPAGLPLALEAVERSDEGETEIGIINADDFTKTLEWTRTNYPEHLAAVVLAGFCGIRSDEIHGKRKNRDLRQTWEDIHLDRKFVRVTVVKKNTPANRFVPLCDAAVEWLMLSDNRKGDVCCAQAMEKMRAIWKKKQFDLPKNCLRHSFISCRLAVTNNKAQVALEAGNSAAQIDKHYRVPLTPAEGAAWFAVRPKDKPDEQAEVIEISG